MKTQANPLDSYSVLITRPSNQSLGLSQLVQQQGGAPVIFPIFDIQPQSHSRLLAKTVADLNRFELVIFVSVHAVHAVMSALADQRASIPALTKVAAIGVATSNCLKGYGVEVNFMPTDTFDSEGLLRVLSDFEAEGAKVAIFRGQNGRELLASELTDRGARVSQIETYRRQINAAPLSPYLKQLQQRGSPLIALTSVAIMQGLLEKASQLERQFILSCPVAVLSQRIATSCRAKGFNGIVEVAARPDDHAMLEALTMCAGFQTN